MLPVCVILPVMLIPTVPLIVPLVNVKPVNPDKLVDDAPRAILVVPTVILLFASSVFETPPVLMPTNPVVVSKFALSKLAIPLVAVPAVAAAVASSSASLLCAIAALALTSLSTITPLLIFAVMLLPDVYVSPISPVTSTFTLC